MIYSADRVCPKCGHDQVSTVFCPGLSAIKSVQQYMQRNRTSVDLGIEKHPICLVLEMKARVVRRHDPLNDPLGFRDSVDDPVVLAEHLERQCARCTYGWCEKPIDQAPALVQLAAQAPEPSEIN